MQSQPLPRFILTNKTRGSHPRVTELQVLMQVVQSVKEVPHVAPEDGKDSVIAVLGDETDEVNAHLVHELAFCYAEDLGNKKGCGL